MTQNLGTLTPTDGRRPQPGDEVVYSDGVPFGVVTEIQPAMFKVRTGNVAHWMILESVHSRRVGTVRLVCDVQSVREFMLGMPMLTPR